MTRALIIVDMQKAYFANPALAAQKEALVTAINHLIRLARRSGVPIISLRTIHAHDESTWTLNMRDDKQGYLLEGDKDVAYVDGLEKDGVTEIVKTRDSGFWQTNLQSILQKEGVTEVIITGVSTHSCVMATAMDAYNANLRVVIPRDAVRSHDPHYHDMALGLLHQEYRMDTPLTYPSDRMGTKSVTRKE